MDDERRVFTDREASEFLRLSQVTLWRLRKSQRITFRRVASKIVYLREDLEDFLDSCKRGMPCERVSGEEEGSE